LNLLPVRVSSVLMNRAFLSLLIGLSCSAFAAARVEIARTPNAGIQPQVVMSADGTAHLIYYKGDDRAGDVYYVTKKSSDETFSTAMRVNSVKGSAIAAGTIRGAQLAIGKNGRAHVIWNGGIGAPKTKVGGEEVTPLLYARMNDAGTGFETERNLITYAAGLDGGSSIAADQAGNVYAMWHGRAPGAVAGEEGRAVFVSRSSDDGKTFSREVPATTERTGACACCGMRAFADANGAVYVLYRAAMEKTKRDEVLLISPKAGEPFKIANRHPWRIETCPMSSAFLAPVGSSGVIAAWETTGQVFFSAVSGGTHEVGPAVSPAGTAKRKHPVAAMNSRGEALFVWTEGTAWGKGGSVAWQVYDSSLKPAGEPGRADGLPVWSTAAVYAKPNGDFVVIY
jgi:hypothetical protein